MWYNEIEEILSPEQWNEAHNIQDLSVVQRLGNVWWCECQGGSPREAVFEESYRTFLKNDEACVLGSQTRLKFVSKIVRCKDQCSTGGPECTIVSVVKWEP